MTLRGLWRWRPEPSIQALESVTPEVLAEQLRRIEATDEVQLVLGVLEYLRERVRS